MKKVVSRRLFIQQYNSINNFQEFFPRKIFSSLQKLPTIKLFIGFESITKSCSKTSIKKQKQKKNNLPQIKRKNMCILSLSLKKNNKIV